MRTHIAAENRNSVVNDSRRDITNRNGGPEARSLMLEALTNNHDREHPVSFGTSCLARWKIFDTRIPSP